MVEFDLNLFIKIFIKKNIFFSNTTKTACPFYMYINIYSFYPNFFIHKNSKNSFLSPIYFLLPIYIQTQEVGKKRKEGYELCTLERKKLGQYNYITYSALGSSNFWYLRCYLALEGFFQLPIIFNAFLSIL